MITTILACLVTSVAFFEPFQGVRDALRNWFRRTIQTSLIVVLCWTPAQAADFGVPEPAKTTRPATMGVPEIKAQVKAIYQAYRSIEVHYVQEVKHDSPSSGVIPKIKYSYAFKGERRLKQEKPLNEQPEKEAVSYTFAFNGEIQQQYCNEPSQLTIYNRKEGFADIDAYITVLGIPMQNTERATASKNPQLLPGCLDIGNWNVLPQLALIDGHECHVLVSSMGHRLWVDSTLGVIRFRETSIPGPENDPADWPINERFYYSNYSKCADGVLLPKLVKVDSFTSTKAPEQKLARQHILDVEEIRVNDDVPVELFTLKVPDGTIVNDMINKKFFKVGDPEDSLERIVSLQPKGNAGGSMRSILIFGNVAAVFVVLFLWRRHVKALK